jgi:hypothetical protein
MAEPYRVLVFPCGSESALEIHAALWANVNVTLMGASSRDDHGRFVFAHYHTLPYLQEADFLPALNRLIEKEGINFIFPAHDTVAYVLSEAREQLKAKLLTGNHDAVRLSRYKHELYERVRDTSFVPACYPSIEEAEFPVFIKPSSDEGGKNGHRLQHAGEWEAYRQQREDWIIAEYLPGKEMTVDCFTDRHRALRFIGPRERHRVFGGISVDARTLPVTEEIRHIATTLNDRIGFRGLWFFQMRQDKHGAFKLMEICSRAAGCMNLYRATGVNLPLLAVYDGAEKEITIEPAIASARVERALINRYETSLEYQTLFMDFDDTVLIRNQVNPQAMTLLYQARRQGKTIILITRHAGNIHTTLASYAIHEGLFDRILQPEADRMKAEYMAQEFKPLLIDNAYAERHAALQKGFPALDVDAIPALIDWRV